MIHLLGFHLYMCIHHLKWLNKRTVITSGFSNDKDSLFLHYLHIPRPHEPMNRNGVSLTLVFNKDNLRPLSFSKEICSRPSLWHLYFMWLLVPIAETQIPAKLLLVSGYQTCSWSDLEKMGFSSALFNNLSHNTFHKKVSSLFSVLHLFLCCNEDSNTSFLWTSKKVRGEKGTKTVTSLLLIFSSHYFFLVFCTKLLPPLPV